MPVAAVLGGAAIGGIGSIIAGGEQAGAAKQAAQLQFQESQNALNFQKQQFATQQQDIAPWLQAGQGGLANLSYLLGIGPNPGAGGGAPAQLGLQNTAAPVGQIGGGIMPQNPNAIQAGASALRPGATPVGGFGGNIGGGTRSVPTQGGALNPAANPIAPNTSLGGFGSLMQPWTQQFQAPTAQQAAQFPGYQFQLQQGLNALQNSAAAQGNLLSGPSQAALNNSAQQAAQSDYNNVYNQALNQYTLGYNTFQQNQANQFNRLASLAGIGQTAAGQLGSLGQQAAGNVANISLGAGGQIGQSLLNQGAATASGYAGLANAAGGGLAGLGQISLLNSLGALGGGSGLNPNLSLNDPNALASFNAANTGNV